MMEQSKSHFEKVQHLVSFELIDPEPFQQFRESFPQKQPDIASKYFPITCREKLKGELIVFYTVAGFAGLNSVISLLRMLMENKREDTFSKTLKLTQIAITTPMTSAEAEWCFSTLKRIKFFLRSTVGQDRLNTLAVLPIERDLIQKSLDFNDKVISMFASQKNR